MQEFFQRFNFFRTPNQQLSGKIRLLLGIVGVGFCLRLLFVATTSTVLLFSWLGLLFGLHYLFSGLAETIPTTATRPAGVLRILALLMSVIGGLVAVGALVVLVIF